MLYHSTRYLVEVISVLVLIGAATYSVFAPAPSTPELDSAVDSKVVVEGVVVREPDVRERAVLLTVKSDVGMVLVRADRFTAVAYGDRILATGKIELPQEFETDTGRTFNYPMYLRAHGISHTMSFAHIEIVSHNNGHPIVAPLLGIKNWFVRGIETALPEPESSLLSGLLLGEKRGLGESLTESFRRSGVIHIIVLSGYNVALVINFILAGAALFLSRRLAFTVAGVAALAFMIMTGASETAVRATLMALVVLVSKAFYRPAIGLRILLMVAAGMAVWNPFLVLFDLSYQLSILATLGLILFSEWFIPYLTWTRSKTLIEIISTTLATQIAVLPLLIYSVGQVSLIALVTNILVLVAVPWAMLFGFIAALLALLSPIISFPVSVVAYALLAYIINVSMFLGSLPFASIQI